MTLRYTHMYFYSGSSETFITEETMTQLGAGGKRVTINLKTVNGDSPSRWYAVSGLEVCVQKESSFVPLPVDSLPVSRYQIPSQHDVDRWDDLSHIDIPNLDTDIGIWLEITCPELLSLGRSSTLWVMVLMPFVLCWGGVWMVHWEEWLLASVMTRCLLFKLITYRSVVWRIRCRGVLIWISVTTRFSQMKKPCLWKTSSSFHSWSNKLLCIRVTTRFACLWGIIPFPFPTTIHWHCKGLEKKFKASDIFTRKNVSFVDDLSVKGHASEVSVDEVHRDDRFLCYLPLHGVIHPRQNKLRIVVDASARFVAVQLSDRLLPGPDLSSSWIGVLVRFRQERGAFMADLDCVFYQFRGPVSQRDLLRFLWWSQCDVGKDIVECRMHAHILVPQVLLQSQSMNCEKQRRIMQITAVDNCLKSVSGVEEGIVLAEELHKLT